MNAESNLAQRLAFNRIDEEVIRSLRDGREFVLQHMPSVLDRFYDHIAKYTEASAFFKGREHMMHAKQMQVNTPPPEGGGFGLRLKAGLIDPSGRFGQTTLKLSSGSSGF